MKKIIISIFFLTFLSVNFSWAVQEVEQSVGIKTKHVYSSDIDATASELELNDTEFNYKMTFKLDNGLPIKVSFNVGHLDINENDPVELPSHLEYRSVGIGAKFPAFFIDNDHYFMGFDVFPTFNTDRYVSNADSVRVPFRTYLIYKESEILTVVMGVWIRPEYDEEVIPLFGFSYQPNEWISFNLISDDPNISYKINEKTKAILEFDMNSQEFIVTRGSQDNVILKYNDFSTGLGLEHHLTDNLVATASVGGVFSRRFEYEDGVGKVDPQSGLYTAFSIKGLF